MKVKVQILPSKKETKALDLPERATVEDAVRVLGLLPDGWIAVRANTPVPSDETLREGDSLKLFSVVSGG